MHHIDLIKLFDDAEIDKASTGAVKGRFINCGQSCIASKFDLLLICSSQR